MKAPLYSKEGHKKGEVILKPEIFGARVNARLLELVRNAYAANLRRGTASTKTRKEVRGGGKKPWKQKGTGRARHSSIRSPIWRGGGTTFGPKPRSYYVALPASMRRSAIISALSLKAQEKKLMVVEDFGLETPKTRELVGILNALKTRTRKTLCIVHELSGNLNRASRNLGPVLEIRKASDFNARDVLQKERLMIEQAAVLAIETRLGASGDKPAGEDLGKAGKIAAK